MLARHLAGSGYADASSRLAAGFTCLDDAHARSVPQRDTAAGGGRPSPPVFCVHGRCTHSGGSPRSRHFISYLTGRLRWGVCIDSSWQLAAAPHHKAQQLVQPSQALSAKQHIAQAAGSPPNGLPSPPDAVARRAPARPPAPPHTHARTVHDVGAARRNCSRLVFEHAGHVLVHVRRMQVLINC